MNALRRSPLEGGIIALALTAGTLLASLAARDYLASDISLLFLLAVWLSAWLGGRAGGLTATGASAIAILYFFLRPDPAAPFPTWSVPMRLAVFVTVSALITLATASWRAGRSLLVSTLSSMGDAVLVADRKGRITYLNPTAETLTGWPGGEARGKFANEVLRLVDEKTRQAIPDPLEKALRDRMAATVEAHAVLVSRTGTEIPIEHSAAPLRDKAGKSHGAMLVFRDIGKRRNLEEQATHAQKMDAVGRLAGGVAGDFNNVLTLINGYAELLRNEVGSGQRKYVDEILFAAARGAAATHHLLAFSGGSTAQPRILDLNAVVGGMEPMLRRLLGQNIELIFLATPGLGRVKADPAQIEQVVVNLVTNSRDAMPQGGKVVMETANVELEEGSAGKHAGAQPGSYVMLAVSDTGTGMAPETRSRLFEPLFTTKAPGRGSGLGLAAVYGIVKQSNGHVTVYSQPGCGTIFEIYLPRVEEQAGEPLRKGSAKGSETILLVDEEEGVRRLVSEVLRTNGYDVLDASTGSAALAAYEKNAHKVDMLLTDVAMAQMNGLELGRQLLQRTPGLKVLYMSGYRSDAASGTPGDAPRAFLHKPFTTDTLLSKVREVLDAAPADL